VTGQFDALREAQLALLNASFEARGWERAIERVAHAVGGSGANLVCLGGPLAPSLNLFVGKNDALAQRSFGKPELWGSCNWRVNTGSSPMTIQHDGHYEAYRQVADTSDYDDAVSDLDIQFGCQSVLIADERMFLGLAVLRGRREGACDAQSLAAFHRLLRPLQRALRMQLALSGEAADAIVEDVGDIDSPVVLIDSHGSVAGLNQAAEQLAGPGGPIMISGLQFELSDRPQNARMQKALAGLLSERCSTGGSAVYEVRVPGPAFERCCNWIARAFRLPQQAFGLGFDPHVAITFTRAMAAPLAAG
jgi:hypothetical protein